MGKPFKFILAIITALALLMVIAVLTLPFVINPNDFKPQIAAAVKDNIGRELVLEGDLSLSVFPWLGISTGKMVLSNAPGFQDRPFAEIEAGEVKIRLLPLLTKKIELSRIVLKGLALNLERNQHGVSNWADLTEAKQSLPASAPAGNNNQIVSPPPASALTVLAIGGIALENAHINWDDRSTGKHIEIQNLNLNTGKFAFNEPVSVELALVLLSNEAKLTESIRLSADLTVNEQLDHVLLSKINLQTTTTGENIPGKSLSSTLTADVSLDMAGQTLKMSDLRLNSGDLNLIADITGTAIKDKPVFQGPVSIAEFNPAKLLKQMAIPLPAMQDANALNKLAITFNLHATENSAALQNLVLNLDDSQAKGWIEMHDFSQTAITFDLALDALDADRYLPPEKTKKKSKSLASPAIAVAAVVALVPVESLRKLNANGQLTVGNLKVSGLNLQGLLLKFEAKNGIVTTEQSIKQFYQGSYSGTLSLDARHQPPKLAVNEKFSQVQLAPLLKDYKGEARMSGVVNATAQLQGQGRHADELKSSLNGQLSFLFTDGIIKGFNLQKIIDQGKTLIKGTPVPTDSKNDQTVFSEMRGTATINQGVIKNNDLKAKASKLRAEGKGTANLNSEVLDYQITATFLKNKADATESEKIEGIPVAVNIGGTFSEPSYTLDIKSLLTDENKAKLEHKKQKLLDKLDKKLGPGASDLLKRLF